MAVESSKTQYNLDFGENPGGTMLCVTARQNLTLLPHSALHFVFASSTLVAPDIDDIPVYYVLFNVQCYSSYYIAACVPQILFLYELPQGVRRRKGADCRMETRPPSPEI